MFKPTPCMQKTLRRLPLSTKQAGREYYKGNRTGTLGTIDKYGRFHPDYSKIRTFVYPSKGTKGFELTPFVSSRTPKNLQLGEKKWETVPEAMTGEAYLMRWKAEGGHDVVDAPYSDPSQEQKMPEVWEEPPKKSEKKFWQK
ncbi:60S ribosomal protein L27, mitochondrial [Paraconiothyrium brasiliense]|uniref:60S ribosomal protein L27, mitochondrial n=1 Tax=Paraconiothyrium brasiliense TaxID=300254 RepID=A0ABR3R7S6_9PLEO